MARPYRRQEAMSRNWQREEEKEDHDHDLILLEENQKLDLDFDDFSDSGGFGDFGDFPIKESGYPEYYMDISDEPYDPYNSYDQNGWDDVFTHTPPKNTYYDYLNKEEQVDLKWDFSAYDDWHCKEDIDDWNNHWGEAFRTDNWDLLDEDTNEDDYFDTSEWLAEVDCADQLGIDYRNWMKRRAKHEYNRVQAAKHEQAKAAEQRKQQQQEWDAEIEQLHLLYGYLPRKPIKRSRGPMYVRPNFKTKKALKEAIAAGVEVKVFEPGPFRPAQHGTVSIEGPHSIHTWHADVKINNLIVEKVLR